MVFQNGDISGLAVNVAFWLSAAAGEQEVYLQDGLGCQRPLAVLSVELVVVESFQVVGSEATDRDLPQCRENVEIELAADPSQVLCATSSFLPGNHRVARHAPKVSDRTWSLRPFTFSARAEASRSASARLSPAGCQRRRSFPVTGSSPS
jgi:hypothetical protein